MGVRVIGSCLEEKKIKKIGARVTKKEKELVLAYAAAADLTESEYVLSSCLKDKKETVSSRQEKNKKISRNMRLEIRVTEQEKNIILEKAAQANVIYSRYVRNCCLSKEIVVIEDLKVFAVELNKVGNNLNQITMLCHQGLITTPDISEVRDILKKVYQELVLINTKNRLSR